MKTIGDSVMLVELGAPHSASLVNLNNLFSSSSSSSSNLDNQSSILIDVYLIALSSSSISRIVIDPLHGSPSSSSSGLLNIRLLNISVLCNSEAFSATLVPQQQSQHQLCSDWNIISEDVHALRLLPAAHNLERVGLKSGLYLRVPACKVAPVLPLTTAHGNT
ncbi:hypothetical protein Tco_0795409 [Tanacetum coccineum]